MDQTWLNLDHLKPNRDWPFVHRYTAAWELSVMFRNDSSRKQTSESAATCFGIKIKISAPDYNAGVSVRALKLKTLGSWYSVLRKLEKKISKSVPSVEPGYHLCSHGHDDVFSKLNQLHNLTFPAVNAALFNLTCEIIDAKNRGKHFSLLIENRSTLDASAEF